MKNPPSDMYHGPALSVTINHDGARIHRLIDDAVNTARPKKTPVRRDPMVEALFGAAVRINSETVPSKGPIQPTRHLDDQLSG